MQKELPKEPGTGKENAPMKKVELFARRLSGRCFSMLRCLAVLLLCALLLAACSGAAGSGTPGSGTSGTGQSGPDNTLPDSIRDGNAPEPDTARTLCRIVDGAGSDTLVLAAQSEQGEVYTLAPGSIPVTLDGKPADPDQLQNGMLVTIVTNGCVETIWPALFGEVYAIEAESKGRDDRCGLVLGAFEELWQYDSALNEDVNILGIDIDEALLPSGNERMAVAWVFSCRHGTGAEFVTGTWQQLADEGYIDGENLYWEDGVLFSINSIEGKEQTDEKLFFEVHKWRSGLGAVFFTECTATMDRSGAWSYEPGGFAIS